MNEFQPQVPKSHYFTRAYNHRGRFIHYWYQASLILEKKVKNVLEIGPGAGVVTNFLRSAGIKVTTLDIDKELKPDVVASVLKMPFGDNEFDLVLASEVLEHLPFENLERALLEIKRVAKKEVIITLPEFGHILLYLGIKIPWIPFKNIFIKTSFPLKKHVFDGQHYWEIGKQGYSLQRIKDVISRAGFKIVKDFVPFDASSTHYFILEK